jgi:integrase
MSRSAQDAPGSAALDRENAGKDWKANGLVFASMVGTELDSHNVRRSFRAVLKAAGLKEEEWTPREMRHSFVSLLSDSGVPLEHISRLVGHSGTAVTEAIYRQQIRPVMEEGATAMDAIFAEKPLTPDATEEGPRGWQRGLNTQLDTQKPCTARVQGF